MTSTATHRPAGGYDSQVGFGIVDAAAALTKAGRLAGARPAVTSIKAAARYHGALPPEPVAPARLRPARPVHRCSALTSLVLIAAAATRLAVLRRPAVTRAGPAPVTRCPPRTTAARRRSTTSPAACSTSWTRSRPGGSCPTATSPSTWAPARAPPGRPGDGRLRRRGGLVAGDPRRRHPRPRARQRGPPALPGRRHPAPLRPPAGPGRHAPRPLARRPRHSAIEHRAATRRSFPG